jgi:hypothetical protein
MLIIYLYATPPPTQASDHGVELLREQYKLTEVAVLRAGCLRKEHVEPESEKNELEGHHEHEDLAARYRHHLHLLCPTWAQG